MRLRRYQDGYGIWREQIILSREEQPTWYGHCIGHILNNTREVLDGLDFYSEFQVNWESYHSDRPKSKKRWQNGT